MKKKRLHKIFYSAVICIILLNLLNPIWANAANSVKVGKANSSTMFSSEYSFMPKFIKNVTTTTSYGTTNYSVDYNRGTIAPVDANYYYSARITSDSQKGNVWVRYNNVGTYNGEIIDLKITLIDWEGLQPANLSASENIGGVNYPTVLFSKVSIDVNTSSMPAIANPVWKFTFYHNKTEKTASIKGHFTFKDIDGGDAGQNESITFKSGFKEVYITKDSYLTLSSGNCINKSNNATENADKKAWITCLTSGDNLTFAYTRQKDTVGNSFRDITQTASKTSRGFYHYIISSESIIPFEYTKPEKKEDKDTLRGIEQLTYTISQFIPGESREYYYKKYIVTDKIANCFEIKNITVSDDTKIDRTSWFDISYDKENNITISAKSEALNNAEFYNNNLYFYITVNKKADQFITEWYPENENSFTVPNSANVFISAPSADGEHTKDLPTNTVEVKINRELELPVAGGYGDTMFFITGIILILTATSLYFKSKIKNRVDVSED